MSGHGQRPPRPGLNEVGSRILKSALTDLRRIAQEGERGRLTVLRMLFVTQ